MAELLVIRHAQASFGADNYDQLSDLGHQQSELAGEALRTSGWVPDRLVTGSLTRQHETLASMGFAEPPEQHAGLNEYDFHDLLSVRFQGNVPDPVRHDRKTHFRTLRETILEWQAGGLAGARESWKQFSDRVENARRFSTDTTARRVLVISSGGPIGELVKASLGAPDAQMMALNLQVKNTSWTRFFFNASTFLLHEFNATPHFSTPDRAKMLTFS
ncbi:histidine phosphatase family protein [Sedimentitalea todarodis]|uniref:Histidine phosphatase family protein n=1 Tax=Sedimentitalea todarodis TaxID=1631240 RepID=A0ABU3VAQ2_9RHOB|nr:histidine phosphatase family protein [Sedimentitalea todarodis]MDU9003247.1 histidine phosphatase family protein [Sedimentitalea todarodis]